MKFSSPRTETFEIVESVNKEYQIKRRVYPGSDVSKWWIEFEGQVLLRSELPRLSAFDTIEEAMIYAQGHANGRMFNKKDVE